MPTAFQELCEQRNVIPEEWKKELATPIIASKCLLDMTEAELKEHYKKVEERAEKTREDRALIILEKAQEGRLERQAVKEFNKCAADGKICADQVPEMLEALRFELTNTEVHYLLRKFDATDDFDMIPEAELTKRQWMWLVGECQMLKDSYKFINPEAFEVCYETMIQNLKHQREGTEGASSEWPHIQPTGPGWFMAGGAQPGYSGPQQPFAWGMHPEVEAELMRQMAEVEAEKAKAQAEAELRSME